MLSCSIWFSAPSLWIDGGLENRCVGRVYGADGAVRRIQLHATYYFIMLMLRSTCFGHHYVHHQELTTIALVIT